MAIAGPLCLITATVMIRSSLAKEPLPIIGVLFDVPWKNAIDYAGSWEAMWRISAMYLLFLITTFKFYLIPTFSKLNNLELKKEVFKVWKFVVPLIIVITLGVYLLDDIIIKVLLSDGESTFDGIFFNIEEGVWPNHHAKKVEVAYHLQINEFNGRRKIQLMVTAIRVLS